MLCIYDYLDYREFLRDFYRNQKKQRFYFSYRYMSQKTGIDPAHIVRIMQGKRHVSDKILDKFIKLCELNDKEARYFEALVAFNKAKSEKQVKETFERLNALTGIQSRKLRADQYEFYQKWYYSAVRALIAIERFKARGDFLRIASRLKPRITARQASEAVSLLKKLNLVAVSGGGILKVTDADVTTGKEWRSLAVKAFQKETIRLSGESIDRHPRELRDVSTVTVGLSPGDLPEVREMISEFRSTIIRFAHKNQNPDDVYQLNVQLFPLTAREMEEGK
jgi:uncharacterized protein (TIGR02147 family)